MAEAKAVSCPVCGNICSSQAAACPQCGHPFKRPVAPVPALLAPPFTSIYRGSSWLCMTVAVVAGLAAVVVGLRLMFEKLEHYRIVDLQEGVVSRGVWCVIGLAGFVFFRWLSKAGQRYRDV